ncbi:MAG: LuxR C-terminal-related transcriptional regulator [Thalassolituus sp.]|uniref:helix-turn-helix transcriptional regulator n=1 Tax=Thalassolituus sp. TaxID=2030822 RepID=UPI0039824F83
MLNKNDYITTIELINRCIDINSTNDFYNYCENIKFKLGIKKVIVIYFLYDTVTPAVLSFGTDLEWQNTYLKEEYYRVDPIINFSLNSKKPIFWSDAYKSCSSNDKHLIADPKNNNPQEGISYGIVKHPITAKSIIISMEIERCENSKNKIASINKIIPHLADVCARQSLWKRPELTPKEKEIIEWCTKGKSYSEIAIINKISERTVKFHMKNIFEKLCVYNKPQAVAKSLSLGLV